MIDFRQWECKKDNRRHLHITFRHMKQYFPPDPLIDLPDHPIFLGGSIEMGNVEDWQREVSTRISECLNPLKFCILNPRRKNWDSSWEQSKDNPLFRGQVEWELEGLERAKTVIMYLHPETKAPISLLELGLYARSRKLLVVCPPKYWRKGNVDIVCERYGTLQFDTVSRTVEYILQTY